MKQEYGQEAVQLKVDIVVRTPTQMTEQPIGDELLSSTVENMLYHGF